MDFHGPRDQIFKEATVTNGTVVVYTVPEGKIFYLIESMLVTDVGAGSGVTFVAIRDGDDAHVRHLNNVRIKSQAGVILADHFEPGFPVDLPAGYDIALTSSIGSLLCEVDIFGMLVNA